MLAPGSMQRCRADMSASSGLDVPRGGPALTDADRRDGMRPARVVPVSPIDGQGAVPVSPIDGQGVVEGEGGEPGGIDRAIDQFLTNYGKPPRSAVRALLDPSDRNIAAMQADQVRQEIVAAYVAQRLTELQSSAAGRVDARGHVPDDLPSFVGMRLIAYVPAGCRTCAALYRMLRVFIESAPIAEVQLAVVDAQQVDPAHVSPEHVDPEHVDAELEVMLDSALPLPAKVMSETQAAARGISSLPALELDDSRSGRRRLLPPWIDASALRSFIVGLRKPAL